MCWIALQGLLEDLFNLLQAFHDANSLARLVQGAKDPFFSSSGQLTITVMGTEALSSSGCASRNRLPSAETSYCRKFESNCRRVGNSGLGRRSLRLAPTGSTKTDIILPSAAT